MELNQFELLLIIIFLSTLSTLIIALGIYLISGKNTLIRDYASSGTLALGTIVLYYLTIFQDNSYWIYSVISTLILNSISMD